MIRNFANPGETSEHVSKALGLAMKVCIGFGVTVQIIYFLPIGYVPQGMTPGDTLFFLLAGGGFAFLYSIHVLGLIP